MISLQKLKLDRTKGADRIIIPKTVLENNIDTVTYEEILQMLRNRQFPFRRCIIEIEEDSPMYFEAITEDDDNEII